MEISSDAKRAILNCLMHAAWSSDNAETYYNALANAFFPLTSITAVYTQTETVTEATPLDDLKADLVVTANYESGDTETVPSTDYTLSGTLATGTSTITVSYAGKTTTFTVTVTADTNLYYWDFTKSLVDTVQGATAVLDGIVTQPTRDSTGVHVTHGAQYVNLGQIYEPGLTVEVEFGTMDRQGTGNGRVLMVGSQASGGLGTGFIYRNNNTWNWYASGSWCTASSVTTDPNYFSNKTLKAVFDDTGYMTVYADSTLIGTSSKAFAKSAGTYLQIGAYPGSGSYTTYYNMTIKTVRIYKEEA